MVRVYRSMYVAIIVLVIALDQLTKLAVKDALFPHESKVLIPDILSLAYVTNTGAIFGVLRGMNALLIAVGIGVVIILSYYIYINQKEMSSYFFALVIGGALSNIIDRIAYGWVIDFIDFHFWPAFNIADTAITTGIIAFIIYSLKND